MALRREQVRPRIRACDVKLYTSEAATLHDRSLGLVGYAGCIGLEFGRMTHACITSAGTATPTTLRLRLHSVGAHAASVISIREIRMINRAVLVLLFLLSGSAIAEEKPPELWSWFKDLSKSKEACEIQSSYALQVIGLENQVENEYGIYGNVRSNRVVVKCIEISPTRSKLMVAVAGYNRDSVELVRNKIISSIQ